MTAKSRTRNRIVATAALLAFTGSLGASAAFAEGGTGGVGGGGFSSNPINGLSATFQFFDAPKLGPNGPESPQGWGQDSINWFLGQRHLENTKMGAKVQVACDQALNDANDRARAHGDNNPKSRVVGIMYALYKENPNVEAARGQQHFFDLMNYWRNNIDYGGFFELSRDTPLFKEWVANLGDDGIKKASNNGADSVSAVCVAVNSHEPRTLDVPPTYKLNITTNHDSHVTEAGSTDPVYDTIHASRVDNKGSDENLNADIILNYEGPEGNKSVTKQAQIANHGDTKSPEFTPADFGWSSWPATGEGKKFWFDIHVAKQGNLEEAIDTADREEAESWAVTPKNPVKYLMNGENGSQLKDQDVLAANMFYNANITAHSNGYSSEMTITDTVNTADVTIGGKDADDAGRVQVFGPDGKRVKADVKIDRSTEGKVIISGTVKDMEKQGTYTLSVPTYTKATGANYRIPDDSKACYTAAGDHCLKGNSAETGKVTPDPDKVWTADESDARTTADPEKTNSKGVDRETFLPGDKVSAVVNDHIAPFLQYNLEEYSITDDWSDGLAYVKMDKAPKVFFQGKDVTKEFEITNDVEKGVTTAKAKPEFLAKTGRLAEPGEVKLVISGEFRRDYDTDGSLRILINKGHVTWNNEMKATNEPPIFTLTPKVAIDVEKYTLDEGLEKGDRDDAKDALTLKSPEDVTKIGFLVKNTGDADLVDVTLADKTHEGTTGNVTDITCEIPADQAKANQATSGVANGTTSGTVKVAGDKIGLLKVGQSVTCTGFLTGVQTGTMHSDTATAEGKSIHNGKKVSDSDDWHATVPAPEKQAPRGAVTGEAAGANTAGLAAAGTLMVLAGAGAGATALARRKQNA